MSFFDPTMTSRPNPKGWENYDLHTEVNESEKNLINYLEKTKWEYFADGGSIHGNPSGINLGFKTRWYGLKRDNINEH